jgi:hypothetical protein
MRGPEAERAIGTVYAINTLGSIIGVALAGLILMPLLGLKRLLVFGACIDIALGVWLVASDIRDHTRREDGVPGHARARTRRWATGGLGGITLPVVATAVLLAVVALVARFDLARITSGVYRHGVVAHAASYSFPYYKDGRTATVSLREDADGFLTLATNGKPDASMDRIWRDTAAQPNARELTLTRDISSQFLLPIITLAHAPRAANAAVIGHGSGMSSHVLLGSPYVRQVVTIEIEPEMVRASHGFYPANRRVFDDPRSLEVIDDAKSYFASAGRKFDLILSEPSNPWVSGVSGLFTQEFYARVREQLAPRGVFGQWLHLYELNDELVTCVLLAIDSEFKDYQIFYTSNSDILIVAANSRLPAPDWSVSNYPAIAHDLRHAIPLAPEWFESLHLASRDVLHPLLLAEGYVNSDYFPALDLGAERLRFNHESAAGYIGLADASFDLVATLEGQRSGFSNAGYSPTPEIGRSSARALGSRLRVTRHFTTLRAELLPVDEDLRNAMYTIDVLGREMGVGRAPVDWHRWVKDVVAADAALHGGTAGAVDSAFYEELRSYCTRFHAPPEARASVDFLHGMRSWDWKEVVDAAPTLIQPADGQSWLADPLVRDVTAVAYIKLGSYDDAKEVLREFARRTSDERFSERLVAAYLAFSDPASRDKLGWH